MNEARDRLIDALLVQRLGERESAMEARYARAFAALEPRAARRAPVAPSALRFARAALIALCATLMLVFLPAETGASSVLAGAVGAERQQSADRRYEIAVTMRPRTTDGEPVLLRGTWDLRGTGEPGRGLSRLELAPEGRGALVRASGPDGAWERRPDGTVRELTERELWPRWIEERDGRVAIERMDELLGLVQRHYAAIAVRAGDESPVELRGSTHIVATRRELAPGPDEIDLWIDGSRGVVLEARLSWKPAPRPPFGARERPSRGEPSGAIGRPARVPPPPRGPRPPAPPPFRDDYRAAPGALPTEPPLELRLRRVEPVAFAADHFARPAEG